MKKIICKNCGASFSDELEKCPYCSTMNKKGAYKKFRQKISDIIDSVLGLKTEAEKSLSQIIITSIVRAFLIGFIVIGLAFLYSLITNTNYYNDRTYDERRLEDIVWENDNIDTLNKAYLTNDFETIDKLYDQNNRVVYNWQHFSSYYLRKIHKDIIDSPMIDEYTLSDALYFLYYPDYFARTNAMSKEEYEDYEKLKESIVSYLISNGYSETELQSIYENHKDEYGYLKYNELKKYVKGENNG